MMHTANGVSKTVDQWAKDLRVPQRAIDLEMMNGRAFADIVAAIESGNLAASGRPPMSRSPSTFVSTTIQAGNKRIFQLHGDCRACMARARDIYDELHIEHTRPQTPPPAPFVPEPVTPKVKARAHAPF